MSNNIDLELRSEFAFLYLKEQFQDYNSIKDYNEIVTKMVETIRYTTPNVFKCKIDFIMEQLVIHSEDFSKKSYDVNNQIFITAITRVIEAIGNKSLVVTKKEMIELENRLDNENCTMYINVIEKIMNYFFIKHID